MILGSVLLALVSLVPASAQTTGLIGGGLTALPTLTLGPNLLSNGGFETMSGSAPAWSTGKGWGVDQLIKHSGSFSYRGHGQLRHATQTLHSEGRLQALELDPDPGVGTGTTEGCGCNSTSVRPSRSGRDRPDRRHPGLDAVRAREPRGHPGRHVTIKLRTRQEHDGHGLVRRPEAARSSRARTVEAFMRATRTSGACSSTTSRRP